MSLYRSYMCNSRQSTPILITKLYVGMVIKNYKQLCSLLEQPVLSGTSKKAQFKEFGRFFSYTKSGNSFQIDEIHIKPLEKVRKVSTTTALQCYSILYDLCGSIVDTEDTETVLEVHRTKKQLQLSLGICNADFFSSKKLVSQATPVERAIYNRSIFAGIPMEQVLDFYYEVDSRGREHIDRLVDSLHKQYLLEVKKTYQIRIGEQYFPCTNEQHTLIREVIGRTLQLDKYQRTSVEGAILVSEEKDIFLQRKTKEFYQDVLADSWMAENGINRVYPAYQFRFTSDLINRLDRYAEIHGITENYLECLNSKAIKYHDRKTEKRVTMVFEQARQCYLPEEIANECVVEGLVQNRSKLKQLVRVGNSNA